MRACKSGRKQFARNADVSSRRMTRSCTDNANILAHRKPTNRATEVNTQIAPLIDQSKTLPSVDDETILINSTGSTKKNETPAQFLRGSQNSARSSDCLLKRINWFNVYGNIGNPAKSGLQFGQATRTYLVNHASERVRSPVASCSRSSLASAAIAAGHLFHDDGIIFRSRRRR